jgi:hypothetical protein
VQLDDERLHSLTAEVKRRGDSGLLNGDELDSLILSWAGA